MKFAPAVLLAFAVFANAQAPDDFDDLARRAESALESQPSEAVDLYKKALALRPSWAEGWMYYGATLYQLGRFAEATDAFRKGTGLQPQLGTAWAFLGLCEAALDDPDQALADIRKGEALGLGNNQDFEVAVRVKAAQILIQSGMFDQAMIEMQALAQKNTELPIVVQTMGLYALAVPAKWSELSAERKAAVELAGKAAWAAVRQRPADAISLYKQLLEQYPKEAGVHYAHGSYLMETDVNAAAAELKTEIQNTPKHWPSYIMLASISMRQGDSDQAKQLLLQAMKIAPAGYRWLCHAEIGHANLIADNLDGAISELETATKLNPGVAQVHFLLSQAYRRAEKPEYAKRETAEFERLKVQQDPLGVPSLSAAVLGGR
jgi:tetratricopeptide (TPR) repeat protein